jgi:thioredoxin-related protein
MIVRPIIPGTQETTMNLPTSAVALLIALTPATALAGGEGWFADYDEAVKVAKEQKKDLLVDFTGSDWCGWCIKLDKEVFAHEAFLTSARKQYVLVALDFPRSDEAKAKVPNAKRNEELQGKHKVRAFPTVLLMTADGDVYGQTGYQAGGPEKYIEHMAELRQGREELVKVKELLDAYEAALGEARDAKRLELLVTLESMTAESKFAGMYAGPVRELLLLDADNSKGLALRAIVALRNVGAADGAVLKAARNIDPKNESQEFEKTLGAFIQTVADENGVNVALEAIEALVAAGPITDPELSKLFHVNAAFWYAKVLDDSAKGKHWALLAKQFAEGDERLNDMLDEILEG